MKPSFFRLPGGNNLEGQTVATRWQWNNTVSERFTYNLGVVRMVLNSGIQDRSIGGQTR